MNILSKTKRHSNNLLTMYYIKVDIIETIMGEIKIFLIIRKVPKI